MPRSYLSRVEPRPASFELDGVEFATRDVSILDMADWLDARAVDPGTPEGIRRLNEIFAEIVVDFPAFREHCVRHGTLGTVLLSISSDVFLDALGVSAGAAEDGEADPTKRPGSSADGPLSNGAMSRVGSSWLDLSAPAEHPTPGLVAQVRLWLAEAEATLGAELSTAG